MKRGVERENRDEEAYHGLHENFYKQKKANAGRRHVGKRNDKRSGTSQ